MENATLAGGCFWCLEAVFKEVVGVKSVVSGYTGGHVANPTYREVCAETTGHAEAVRITFDETIIRYQDLLEIFFEIHDPTTKDRQGNDVGSSYRSAIYTHSQSQKLAAESMIASLDASGKWQNPIVTELVEAGPFYEAENYHQDYFELNPTNPYCRMVVSPKVQKFRKRFQDLLK